MPQKSRVLMNTSRAFSRAAFRGSLSEFQDVVAEVDDVDVIELEARPGFSAREAWLRRFISKDVSNRLAYLNPGLREVRVEKDYDLFFVVCHLWWDLLHVNAIKGWKEHCKTSVCLLNEHWAASIPDGKHWQHLLNQFDHVLVGLSGTAKPLEMAIHHPCTYLLGAVDTLRWSPFPHQPERVIDVCSIGRRWDGLHRAVLDLAARDQIFYFYDTASAGGEMQVQNLRQHRDLLASMAKRSRFFMVAPAKMGVIKETHGQNEVGSRFFEGAAAGAVLIGQAPDCDSYRDNFDWPEAVIPVNPDGSDIAEILKAIASDPARFAAISCRNAVESLRRHDWVYRWRRVLTLAGLEPTPALLERELRLAKLADAGSSSV
jgi:hypothetical protein